jgi:putative ABC transport system permease protein
MWSDRLRCICFVLCLLAMAGCDRIPPADSYRGDNFTLAADGNVQTVRGAVVSPAFFQAAPTPPLVGRLFTSDEYKSDKAAVVVLHHRLWQERFKADPASIGKAVQLNGQTFTIVGVMPPTFVPPSDMDLWVPLTGSH